MYNTSKKLNDRQFYKPKVFLIKNLITPFNLKKGFKFNEENMHWGTKLKSVICLIFLIIKMAECQYLQLTITPTVTEVQQLSDYDFVLNFYQIYNIPAGSIIMVTFPTDYESSATQSYNCSGISWTGASNLVCEMENRVLKITGGFPSDINQNDVSLQLSVMDMKNPIASGQTSTFQARLVSSNSTTLVSSGAFGDTIMIFSSGSLSMQTSVFPTTVNQVSTLTVTVSTRHKIPKTGYLNLRLDTYWKTNIFNTSQVVTDSSQCFPLANVSSNIRCSITSGTTQLINLVIRYLFDEDFTGSFSFTIFPFLNPPTTAPQGSFQLTSYNSDSKNQKIDSVMNQYLSGVTVNEITSAKIMLNSYIISSETQATIQCYINNIIGPNDKIYIQFPVEFQLSNLSIVLAQNYQATNLVISSGNLLSFKNLILNSAGTVQFVVKNVILPKYSNTFTGFSIKTERNSYAMDFINNPFLVKTLNGGLNGQISAGNNEVGVFTDYQMIITLTNMLNMNDFLVIEFGSLQYLFNLSNVGMMTCVSSRRSGCMIQMLSLNRLKLSSIFIDQTDSLTLVIKNIQNPYNLGLTTSLIMTSFRVISSSQYSVDKSRQSDIRLNLMGRKLSSSSVLISSTSEFTYEQCELSIEINNNNPVPVNSYVDVLVPSQLMLPQRVVCNFGCNVLANATSTVRVYLNNIGYGINNIVEYNIGQLPTMILFNIRNPLSTKPTSTFAVTVYNSLGQVLQYTNPLQGGIVYKVNKPSIFSLSISRNSSTNNISPVSYTFTINSLFQINTGVIVLEIPSYIQCLNNCAVTYLNSTYYQLVTNTVSTNNNTVSSNNKVVPINYEMRNHYSFQPLTINVKYLTNDQLYQYGRGSTTVSNNIASALDVSISWSNQQLLSKGSLLINNLSLSEFNSMNETVLLMEIVFGSDSDLSNSSTLLTYTKTTNAINIQVPVNYTDTIQILNLSYPSKSPSLPVHITIKTLTGQYIISKSNPIYWSTSCTLPCRTCSSTNLSSCQSCYSNSSLVDGSILYQPSTNQCVRVCDNRYFPNLTDNKCYLCSPQCYNCDSYDKCTSCNPGSYLLKQNYTCYLNQCPNGYFIYYSQCKLCTPTLHCKTCTDSLTCTSCIDTFFYYQQKCLSNCPVNITTENIFTNYCDPCPTNCSTCQKLNDSTVKCLSCQNGFFFDSGACYQTCRTPGLVPDGQICVTCHPTCLTCRFNKYYCLTCNTSTNYQYFFNNTCLINCPSGYYNSQTEPYSCLVCTQPCQSCTNSSVQSCSSCVQGYSLNGRICESTCSPTFYSFNGTCLPCVPPCKTCTTESSCMTCQTNYSLFVDQCVSNCNDGYVSISGQCMKCSDNCRTCSAVNYCSSCFNNSFLYQGQCLDSCPVKYYKNMSSWRCDGCLYSCLNCLNQNYCTSCQSGYQLSLLTNLCINTCLQGYIPVSGVCTQCNSNCSECVETVQKCTVCEVGYYYAPSEFKCYGQCLQPLRQYEQNKSCLLLCPQPSYQESIYTVIDRVSYDIIYCRSCPSLCVQCISLSHCTQCANNTYKYGNLCVPECPALLSPYVYNNSVCRTCNVLKCFECLEQRCKQCESGYLLIGDSLCLSNCSINQYYNATNKQCVLINNSTINNNTNNNNNNNTDSNNNTSNNTSNSTSNNTSNNNNTMSQASSQSMRLNFVPFPLLIIGFLLSLIVLVIYLSQSILVIPLVSVIIGLMVMLCAYITLLVLVLTKPLFDHTQQSTLIALIILPISIALIIAFNCTSTVVYCNKVQHPYKKYGKLLSTIIFLLSSIVNFSTYQILNSKIYHYLSLSKQQNQPFWQLHNKLTKISSLTYISFIVASMILIFTLNTSQYLFYSCIELTILSLIQIALIILSQIYSIDYSISQTQSYQINDSFNKLQDFSINQKEINSQIQSITTIHPQSQIPFQSTLINKNQNIMQKTKSLFFPINKKSQLTDFLPSFAIKQAIQDGIFRQNYSETKRKEEEQNAMQLLDSASKMKQKQSSSNQKIPTSLSNQVNIFDIGDDFQQQQGSHKQILESLKKQPSENKQDKGSSSRQLTVYGKPSSPQRSKRRSRQTEKRSESKFSIRSKLKNDDMESINKSEIKELPLDSAQDLDNMITAQIQKQKLQLPSEKADSQQLPEIVLFHKKQDQIIDKTIGQKDIRTAKQLKKEKVISEITITKQPQKQLTYIINKNPNIIFQAIDQQADQYETKVSPPQTHLGTQQDQIQSIDIFKNNTNNHSSKQMIPKIHKINPSNITYDQVNPSKIKYNKPKINLIRDTQVDILSSHLSTQQNDNWIQNQHKQQQNLQIYDHQNIFIPKDDLQDQIITIKTPQNDQLNEPKDQIKQQIQHADFESIYTVSDKDKGQTQQQQKVQPNFYKTQYNIKRNQKVSKNNSKPLLNMNDSLIEDIEDFQQDNQKPSNLFSKPPIKNVLSNQYSEMPIGVQSQKRNKKINFSPKKNPRK